MERKDTSEPRPREGATTELPHDRITVARFREAFPRARWSDRLNAWFVPGRTAEKRIGRWLAEMEAEEDRFADEKGRESLPSSRSKAATLRRHRQPSRSGRPIHGPWSTKSAKFPTRVGTPIAASGRCPTAHLKNSGNAGRQSRRPPSAMSRKQGGRGARRSRGPSRTKHAEPGQGSGGGSATRLPAMTPRP